MDPSQLRFVSASQPDPNGRVLVRYEQFVGDALVWRSDVTVELDADGNVRTLRSGAFPAVEAQEFTRTAEEIEGYGEALQIGDVHGARKVIFDANNPRAGWALDGVMGTALIDDRNTQIIEASPSAHAAPVEIGAAQPSNWTLYNMPPLAGPYLLVVGDSNGAPSIVPGARAGAYERSLWDGISAVARHVEHVHGVAGFGNGIPSSQPNWSGVVPGSARLITQSPSAARAFYRTDFDAIFVGGGPFSIDKLCHEYGHALQLNFTYPNYPSSPFIEAMADAFAIDCQIGTEPHNDPFLLQLAPGQTPVHDMRTPRNNSGHTYAHYDQLVRSGLRPEDLQTPYESTFILTHAFFHLYNTYGIPRDQAGKLIFEGLKFTGYQTYPELRDRYMITALSWARAGVNGFNDHSVCNVAMAFRETGLDGEYGHHAGACIETGGEDLTCTRTYCPVCERLEEDPTRNSQCSEEQLRGPTCATAFGDQTCAGSLTLAAVNCPEGHGRYCYCVTTPEGRAEWSCNTLTTCLPLSQMTSNARYCPEPPPVRNPAWDPLPNIGDDEYDYANASAGESDPAPERHIFLDDEDEEYEPTPPSSDFWGWLGRLFGG